jgi:hypothetical protein
MSTLTRIESEVAGLPAQDQRSLLTWLQGRLTSAPEPTKDLPEPLKVFQQLQREIGLTAEAAETWKASVADSRR